MPTETKYFDLTKLLDQVVTFVATSPTNGSVDLFRGRVVGRRTQSTIADGKVQVSDVVLVKTENGEFTVDEDDILSEYDNIPVPAEKRLALAVVPPARIGDPKALRAIATADVDEVAAS